VSDEQPDIGRIDGNVHWHEMFYASLRSAFIIRPWSSDDKWDLFVSARAQPVPGAPGVLSTRAHTNIPRSGDSGLPRDWSMTVTRWRATANVLLEEPVLDWASETSVHFRYNMKQWADANLVDLLLGAQPISEGPMDPLLMRDSCCYGVEVITGSASALAGLRDWLRRDQSGVHASDLVQLRAELELLRTMSVKAESEASKIIAEGVEKVQRRFAVGRSMTCWVHIEGLLKSHIV